jgi:hypothetical protein
VLEGIVVEVVEVKRPVAQQLISVFFNPVQKRAIIQTGHWMGIPGKHPWFYRTKPRFSAKRPTI